MALLCQRRREFVGVQCGYGPVRVNAGRENSALLIDCRDLSYRRVDLDSATRIVICNTRKQRSLETSEYNQRRAECEGCRHPQSPSRNIKALRDVTPKQLEENQEFLPELNYRRPGTWFTRTTASCRRSTPRTQGYAGLRPPDVRLAHQPQDDYEVSCPELDVMVELASQQEGSGWREMTGAGFAVAR